MLPLEGKNILVGITGGIAAYKTASLIRLLVKSGAEVRAVMSANAKHFITPLTIATLSRNPIAVEFFDPENGAWNSHVSLGEWADMFLIAPLTASTLGKMTSGVADNLLVTTYLSAKCPVVVAPAMDLDMYAHITTQNNLKSLKQNGVSIIEAGSGFLASGLEGKGRMAEPEEIHAFVENFFNAQKPLLGKRALLTVGGSVEMIDSVRCITNHSTGKMGYAVAKQLVQQGAEVTIVRASVDANLVGSIAQASEIEALSAQSMFEHVDKLKDEHDIIVMAAAVADFTPLNKFDKKIKKEQGSDTLNITLVKTVDIAQSVGRTIREDQCFVGFALESHDEREAAIGKLNRKKFDIIVLNSLKDQGAGFGHNTNKITIFTAAEEEFDYPLKSKQEVAEDIVEQVCSYFSHLK